MNSPLFLDDIKPLCFCLESPSSISPKKSPATQKHTHSPPSTDMAPITLNFVRRDAVPVDPDSTFGLEEFRVMILGQPAPPHRSVWTPAEPSAFNLPILLFLIALCVVGAIMVFILWRWLPFFSDLHSESSTWKDFSADPGWNDWYIKPARAAISASASTEPLVERKIAPPPHVAGADDAAAAADDALARLTTPKNQRQTAHVKFADMSEPGLSLPPVLRSAGARW
ncbi:hypothetical protein C8R43DRAFT_975848 [Mycena crocata]|nr:hypothetical protein C8R43DRAFT_975848 [Mycena crocata]